MSDTTELFQELQLGIGDADETISEIWNIIWKKAEDATKAKILAAVEGLQGWDFDEFADFFESAEEGSLLKRTEVLSAIKKVTG